MVISIKGYSTDSPEWESPGVEGNALRRTKLVIFDTPLGLVSRLLEEGSFVYALEHKRNLGEVANPDFQALTRAGVMAGNIVQNEDTGQYETTEAWWWKPMVSLSINDMKMTDEEKAIIYEVANYQVLDPDRLPPVDVPYQYGK